MSYPERQPPLSRRPGVCIFSVIAHPMAYRRGTAYVYMFDPENGRPVLSNLEVRELVGEHLHR